MTIPIFHYLQISKNELDYSWYFSFTIIWESLERETTILKILTLFYPGGGHYGPPYHESVCRCRMVRATLTKLPDFVPFHICQVPESQFWCLFFKKLKKFDVENFWGSSSIRRKPEKNWKKIFFANKNLFFQAKSKLYSAVSNKQAGSNKRAGWKFYDFFIGKQVLIREQGGKLMEY